MLLNSKYELLQAKWGYIWLGKRTGFNDRIAVTAYLDLVTKRNDELRLTKERAETDKGERRHHQWNILSGRNILLYQTLIL